MYIAAVFLPLLSFLIAGLFGNAIGNRLTNFITCSLMIAAAAFAGVIFYDVALMGQDVTIQLAPWIFNEGLNFFWALRYDTLSAIMMVVVCSVSACVHVYSVGYMSHDDSVPRFMAYLGLFTFAMLMLITADNLVQMFFGWEGVGLASYLLIGFWYKKESANKAAMKAFVVNRVGDFGFTLGIFACFILFGSVNLNEIFNEAPLHADAMMEFLGFEFHALSIIGVLLFIGAMGKSAQLGLHTWLPDAMEGPTPVSALIHAATMVTAGVFMIARMSPLFEYAPAILDLIAVIGASTAFFAATVALTQNDIKRVIAYSTCSQLGYMFFAIGVSAYGAAIFHLFTHAFFKALLFLGSGSVIHAMSNEQDMRKMGGLWKKIPYTYVCMWVGSLALAGLPFFAGYYSKDMILESAYAAHSNVGMYAFVLGLCAAALTAFYSWRLLFMTFHGQSRASKTVQKNVHESPLVMTVPLFVLTLGALFSGYLGYELFVGHGYEGFWRGSLFVLGDNVMEAARHVPLLIKKAPIILSVIAILLAWVFYVKAPHFPGKIAKVLPGLYQFSLNKWYFDELYDRIFVQPATNLGKYFWNAIDVAIIDNLGPNGLANLTRRFAGVLSRLQTGYLYHYAFAMLIGVLIFVTYFLARGGF